MQKLLDEISVIPGVAGSCIFDRDRGVVCRKMGDNLSSDITNHIGMNFIRLLQMAALNKLDVKSAQFRFDKYWLVGIPLQKGVILLTICDLQANCSLVASTAAMLVEDMRDEITKPSKKQLHDLSEFGDEDIQKYLAEIENAFAAAIGPVAKMIISDYVYKWIQNGPPSVSRLPELLNSVAQEIEDSTLIEEFRSRLQHLF
jgi:hypothetical protein